MQISGVFGGRSGAGRGLEKARNPFFPTSSAERLPHASSLRPPPHPTLDPAGCAQVRACGLLTQSPKRQPVSLAQHEVESGIISFEPLPLSSGEENFRDFSIDAAVFISHHKRVHLLTVGLSLKGGWGVGVGSHRSLGRSSWKTLIKRASIPPIHASRRLSAAFKRN